jgi:hypothetical protein
VRSAWGAAIHPQLDPVAGQRTWVEMHNSWIVVFMLEMNFPSALAICNLQHTVLKDRKTTRLNLHHAVAERVLLLLIRARGGTTHL